MTPAPSPPAPPPPGASPPGVSPPPQHGAGWHGPSALAGALIGAIILGGLVWGLRRPTPPPITLYPPPTLAPPTVAPAPTPAPLVVFVSGAVQQPGVYSLPAGARVTDAVAQAGGLAAAANPDAVNLAAPLADGDQVHVPTREEAPDAPPAGISGTRSQELDLGVADPTRPVNINQADAAELELLPGIGPSRAQAIIANRPYSSIDDLERVPGIGPATLEQLRPYVVVE